MKGARKFLCGWIIDQEAFTNVLPMFLLVFGIPPSCFEVVITWCFQQGLDQKITRDSKEHFQDYLGT
jgi:hypothetical protein